MDTNYIQVDLQFYVYGDSKYGWNIVSKIHYRLDIFVLNPLRHHGSHFAGTIFKFISLYRNVVYLDLNFTEVWLQEASKLYDSTGSHTG